MASMFVGKMSIFANVSCGKTEPKEIKNLRDTLGLRLRSKRFVCVPVELFILEDILQLY